LDVLTELPDEVENGCIGAAFGGERANAACSQDHSRVEEVGDERVGCLLQGCAVDVAESLYAEPYSVAEQ
jgi:hypothetical protein